jgi:phage repressor protein C with HTH and peptisase S24 domain
VSIGADIEQIRVSLKLTQQEMADKLGISQVVYNQIKSGRTKKVPFEVVERAKKEFGLYDNINNVINEPSTPYTLSPEGKVKKKKVLEGFSQIPYYDVDFAAGNLELSESSNTKPAYMMDIPIFNGCAAFNVYSDSMESLIKAGNIMFCSKLKDWESHLEFGQIYAVSMNDNRRYLKYIKKSKDDTKFLLESANDFYEPFEIPKSKIRSIWLVEGWMAKKTQ